MTDLPPAQWATTYDEEAGAWVPIVGTAHHLSQSERAEAARPALLEPFPPSAIGKKPQKTGPALDYVGHAAVTQRLLTVDPLWNWEPVAWDSSGRPKVNTVTHISYRKNGPDVETTECSMWIKMTVAGVTRLGVGTAELGTDIDKRLISDAIRNAAMRFGVGLDLWSKEDLQAVADDTGHAEPETPWWAEYGWDTPAAHDERRDALMDAMKGLPADERAAAKEAFTLIRWGSNAERSAHDEVLWVPQVPGNPRGPGQLATAIPVAVMDTAEEWLSDRGQKDPDWPEALRSILAVAGVDETQAVADANAALDEVGGGDPFTSLDDLARNSLWRAWLVDHARGTDGPP
ncbi:MAG: hypothetical protein GY925_22285, partial [Actinomycetia bacterium]|nr:hypothetical protein [Actinomycetes bacterium]